LYDQDPLKAKARREQEPLRRTIAAEIEAEQALIAANRELIARMEKKVQFTLARASEDAKRSNVPRSRA
jgi:hypothetical protein